MHCPAHTSTSFGAEVTTSRMGGPDSKKCTRPRHYTMMRDVREEFVGSYSALKEKQDIAGKDQSYAPMCPVDPNTQGMKWMKERQRSYRDVQLEFWLLLRPLMDGGEESTRQLACILLSVWHWSSAVNPPTYPPAPTSMNIGYWLHESDDEDERQLWIEAYACALQRVAEASVGQRWISYRGIRVPKISRVVEIFLHATGTWVSPNLLCQCWPARHDETPVQNLDGIRQNIIHKLDKIATRMYINNHMGPIRIPPNGSGILERRSFVLPSWENARHRNAHAWLQTNASRQQRAVPPLWLHPHF